MLTRIWISGRTPGRRVLEGLRPKHLISYCLVNLLLLFDPAYASNPTISPAGEFARAITSLRADARNRDKFKEAITLGVSGKPFKLEMPFRSAIPNGAGVFDYRDGKLILGFTMNKMQLGGSQSEDAVRVFLVSYNERSVGNWKAQNAFGAKTTVNDIKVTGAGLAVIQAPQQSLGPPEYSAGWWITLPMPPSQAKKLALEGVAIAEGTFVTLPSGAEGFCASDWRAATIGNPTSLELQNCYLGVNISKIKFINKRTGALIKEWQGTDIELGPQLWRGIRIGMNAEQVKAVFPDFTGSFVQRDGTTIYLVTKDDLVSAVRISIGLNSRRFFTGLSEQLGAPITSKCFPSECQAKWIRNDGVAVYLSRREVLIQSVDERPPFGF